MAMAMTLRSSGRTRVGNLQNWHPAACGDLNSANDNDIITIDPPLSNPPVGLASSGRGCVLHRDEGRPSNFSWHRLRGPEQKKKEPYREKSVNDSSNELRKPLQRDFIAMSRLIPDLYLTLPSFVSGPLRGNNVVSRTGESGGGDGRGGGRGKGKGEMNLRQCGFG